jgi:ABC-type Na+ efflux pump permease subunit
VATSFVLAAAGKDLRRRFRDPYAMLLWLGIPLVIGTLIGAINREGAKPRGVLLVADHDDSFLSHAVATSFAQKPMSDFFDVRTLAESAGRARMNEGDASALLVIPHGFGRALLEDEPARLELVRNPSQRILPAMAEESLSLMTEAVFYAQRIAGDRLREKLHAIASSADESAWTESFVSDFSVEIRRTIERLAKQLSPLLLDVDVEAETKPPSTAPAPGFASLFFPSMIFMALFFMAQGLSEDVWREKTDGTLRRALASPRGLGGLLAGKLLAAAALLAAVAALAVSIGAMLFGFHWADAPLAAVWLVAAGVVLTALLTLAQLFASSQRAGHLLSNTLVFPLTMIGGSFFPFEAMPAWMAAIGRKTPNGWALEQFKAILFERASAGDVALGFLALAAVFGLVFAACQARLAGAFARNA